MRPKAQRPSEEHVAREQASEGCPVRCWAGAAADKPDNPEGVRGAAEALLPAPPLLQQNPGVSFAWCCAGTAADEPGSPEEVGGAAACSCA